MRPVLAESGGDLRLSRLLPLAFQARLIAWCHSLACSHAGLISSSSLSSLTAGVLSPAFSSPGQKKQSLKLLNFYLEIH